MVDPLNSLLAFASGTNTTVRILVTVIILVLGHLGVKLAGMTVRRFWIRPGSETTKKEIEGKEEAIRYLSYLLDAVVIAAALFYLNAEITETLFLEFGSLVQDVISVLLMGILGVIIINIFTRFLMDFLRTIGVKNYFREAGLSIKAFSLISGVVKAFLYLLLLQVMMDYIEIGQTMLNQLINASSWALAFLIAGLVFYGFKDLFQNFAAGIYLKNSRLVRPGEEVKIEDESGEIREITMFSTAVDTATGYTLLTPNREIMKSNIHLKRTKSDLDTLEDITSYFVAQNPSYCGPASIEMALEIFGYRHSQDEIGEKSNTEKGSGAKIENLIDATEELTDNEVKGAFVEYDKIGDLGEELKAWFKDGALVVPNFYKPEIFPDASAGHYVLAVGVEGSEILIMDPSGTNGGVYYVNKDKLYDAMAEYDHSRGYIVLAPEGTTAHWRVKNDLIYSDRTYYEELSKTLETRLRKIMRQGRILKDVTPSQMERYMERWRSKDSISRVWQPRTGEDNRDETSDSN